MSVLIALRVLLLALLRATACSGGFSESAQEPDQSQADKTAKAKETGATEQRQSTKDRELTRRIRRAIVTDKSLSTYAQNIKIVVHDGAVTLFGRVQSEQERNSVKTKAAQLAGAAT